MNEKPYIGITGITEPNQAHILANCFKQYLPEDSSHIGMAGYLVSEKMLHGIPETNQRFPSFDSLSSLLRITASSGLNTIHYRTSNKEGLASQIVEVFKKDNIYEDDLCRTVQLNLRYPNHEELLKVKDQLPKLDIIFLISGRMMRRNNTYQLGKHLERYQELADYILIDPSGGRGVSFDERDIKPYFDLAKIVFPNAPIILAGGFNPENVIQRVYQTSRLLQTEEFGIDAESGLRDRVGRRWFDDVLNTQKVANYLEQSAAFFNR